MPPTLAAFYFLAIAFKIKSGAVAFDQMIISENSFNTE
jgi:hypothetical protein